MSREACGRHLICRSVHSWMFGFGIPPLVPSSTFPADGTGPPMGIPIKQREKSSTRAVGATLADPVEGAALRIALAMAPAPPAAAVTVQVVAEAAVALRSAVSIREAAEVSAQPLLRAPRRRLRPVPSVAGPAQTPSKLSRGSRGY